MASPDTPLPKPEEDGDPSIDTRAFRRALGQFATGITIVTTRTSDLVTGVTANSFTSVSLDPPLVLWALEARALSLPAFREAGRFAVNVLSAEQVAESTHFARSGLDKFNGVAWEPGANGMPLLPGAAAHFECSILREHDGGDHVIFIGRVERFARFDREVLLYAHGRYGLAAEHPTVDVSRKTLAETGDPHPLEDFLLPQLFSAYEGLSNAFEHHRDSEGLTINQSRVLACLAANPGSSVEALARASYVGFATTEEALSVLLGDGLAAMRPPGAIDITTKGRDKLAAIIARARSFEAEQIAGIPTTDLAAFRRVLTTLVKR